MNKPTQTSEQVSETTPDSVEKVEDQNQTERPDFKSSIQGGPGPHPSHPGLGNRPGPIQNEPGDGGIW